MVVKKNIDFATTTNIIKKRNEFISYEKFRTYKIARTRTDMICC